MLDDPLPLPTPRLLLRRFRPDDAPTLHAYRNDPDTARYQSWEALTVEGAERFVAAQAAQPAFVPYEWLQIALETKADGRHVGDLALKVDGQGQAEIGFTLAPEARGRGYAREAVAALLGHLFGPLGLHRVTALTDSRNAPSMRLLESLGFRREALHLESYNDGTADAPVWVDECAYALLAREWRKRGDARAG